jgi:fructose-specific phosphotransferase system IIA component
MNAFGIDVAQDAICILPPGLTKHQVLDTLVDRLSEIGHVANPQAFRQAIHAREAVMSTGIGSGIAIPHVRIEEITQPTVGVAVSKSGIDYAALDNAPVHVVVMFAMPSGADREYLGLLAQVMMVLKEPEFLQNLLRCSTTEDVARALNGDAVLG